jgi:hypothetical protein
MKRAVGNTQKNLKLEAAQMRCLIPLLGLTRRDKEGNVDVRERPNQEGIADEIKTTNIFGFST